MSVGGTCEKTVIYRTKNHYYWQISMDDTQHIQKQGKRKELIPSHFNSRSDSWRNKTYFRIELGKCFDSIGFDIQIIF